MDKTIKTLTEVLQESKKEGTTPYDTTAEVVRIEGKTAWVHIPGGIDETPVSMTIDARAGDIVQVRVAGGRAWITGNQSAPPTDDKVAKAARTTAAAAEAAAETAAVLSETAKKQAAAAAKVAADTEQHFWFTETGADTGAHITEKTQEDFLDNPSNGGGNLLARSNGIALRDGLTEISKYMLTTNSLGHIVPTMMMSENNRLTIVADETPGEIVASIVADPGGVGLPAYIIFTADQSNRNVSIAGDTSISGDMQTSGDITANGHSTPIGTVKTARLATATNVARNTYFEVCNLSLEAGTWLITAYVRWANNNNGVRLANIATTSGNTASNVLVPPANGNVTGINFTRIFTPTTTTTYYLNAYHNSTTTPLQMAAGNSDGTINGMCAVRIA